jgi:hypothetical protein
MDSKLFVWIRTDEFFIHRDVSNRGVEILFRKIRIRVAEKDHSLNPTCTFYVFDKLGSDHEDLLLGIW